MATSPLRHRSGSNIIRASFPGRTSNRTPKPAQVGPANHSDFVLVFLMLSVNIATVAAMTSTPNPCLIHAKEVREIIELV
jgi:hypothetical protein